jgi:formyltetrahydrofolate deformylase
MGQVGDGNTAVLQSAVAEVARRFDMKWDIFYDSKIKRVAVFVSKMDHCLWDLLIRHQAGKSCTVSATILLIQRP